MEKKEPQTDSEKADDASALRIEKTPSPEELLAEKLSIAERELLYLRAEFENFRKRIQRENEQALRYANEKLIYELGPIVDLLDRALLSSSGDDAARFEKVVHGISLTRDELIQLLARFGVQLIGQVGENFDPTIHEAIAAKEGVEAGKVLEVMNRGVRLNGRTIRPAHVIVST